MSATSEGDGRSIDLRYPFAGAWLVQNSPANRVPSHGTDAFASSFAIDFVPVGDDGRSAPMSLAAWFQPQRAECFSGFGRALVAPVSGTVVAVRDGDADHHAYRGLPSVGYALGQRRRAAAGWASLAGNHILISTAGIVVALCHLQRRSIVVAVGQTVDAGDRIGGCGNSGNSTEPHVHVQAIDRADVDHARPVALTFLGGLPRNGDVISAS